MHKKVDSFQLSSSINSLNGLCRTILCYFNCPILLSVSQQNMWCHYWGKKRTNDYCFKFKLHLRSHPNYYFFSVQLERVNHVCNLWRSFTTVTGCYYYQGFKNTFSSRWVEIACIFLKPAYESCAILCWDGHFVISILHLSREIWLIATCQSEPTVFAFNVFN